jgi:hypothetical protein
MSLLKDLSTAPQKEVPKPEVKPSTINSLIKEFTSVQTALKSSDATDAGKTDVVDKGASDIGFNLMRNTINTNGDVTGSDVADYIERAEELNDEVETVPFGLETDDGQIVKVYVNAEQADQFEEAMKNMLGLEDDIEEAINRLTTEFDIVDVVWPRDPNADGEEGDDEEDPDADLELDDYDPEDDKDFADDEYDVIASSDDLEPPEADPASGKPKISPDDPDPDSDSEDDDDNPEEEEEEEEDSNDENSEEEDDDENSGEDKPKKRKKKKAQPAEPASAAEAHIPSGPVLNEGKKPWAVLNKIAKEQGEFGFTTLDSDDQAKLVNIKALDKLADEQFGEFGFSTLDEKDQQKLINKYPQHLKGKAKKMLEENTQEKSMTIGSKFLSRVINEAAPDDRDGIKDGFNIPLDSQARAMAAKLKLPFAKRLVAFHFMCGIPGRYMNTAETTEALAAAADMLRKKVAVRRAFVTLYTGLAAAKGYNIPQDENGEVQEGLSEAKSDSKRLAAQNPEKIMKAKEALKKAKKALADHLKTYDGGTGMREKQLQAQIDAAQAKLKKLTESEQLDEAKAKRGSFIQKLLESVLVALGVPENLITTTGPAAIGTGIYQTAEIIEQDSTLERALRLLATRLDIRGTDATEPVQEATFSKNSSKMPRAQAAEKAKKIRRVLANNDVVGHAQLNGDGDQTWIQIKADTSVKSEILQILSEDLEEGLDEAVDVGNDEFIQAVVNLVSSLGVPDDVIERRRQAVIQALRQKKASIRNRGQVMTMMDRLSDLVKRNTVDRAAPTGNEETNEAASRWKHLSGLQEASKRKEYAEIKMKDVLAAMGGKAEILKKYEGKHSEDVADALEKVANRLAKETGAYETVQPEYHELQDWADNYFNAK